MIDLKAELNAVKRGSINKDTVLAIVITAVCIVSWLIHRIDLPPRFLPVAFEPKPWLFISLGINAACAVFLLSLKKRKMLVIPLIFSLFQLAYLAIYLISTYLMGADFSNFKWKIMTDAMSFGVEALFLLPILFLMKKPNPFALNGIKSYYRPGRFKKDKKGWFRFAAVNFIFLLQIGVTVYLIVTYPSSIGITPQKLLEFLPYQILFAVTLGVKEEFYYRWVIQKNLIPIMNSKIIPVLLISLLWGFNHQFFGEGTGTGLWAFAYTAIAAAWFGFLTEEFDSIIHASIAHVLIEVYGFYLMYGVFILKA